jgi:hypothetical protein
MNVSLLSIDFLVDAGNQIQRRIPDHAPWRRLLHHLPARNFDSAKQGNR